MVIYKIFHAPEWDAMQTAGQTDGAPVDLADGFVHFSTAEQVKETASRHFAGASDLVLVAANPATMGDALRWEASRGGAEFPHLYAPFAMVHVLWSRPLPLDPGGHRFPDLV